MTIPAPHDRTRRVLRALLAAALVGLALLPGCGGGVGTGGTGSYGAAPIGGFGSIFVGDIEFDEAGAALLDDDGAPLSGGLRLGMAAQVEGGAVTQGESGPGAQAGRVRIVRIAVGPIASSDVGARTFTVLGQVVQVNGSTVFDASLHGGLAALKSGDLLAVHALADTAGRPVATRVEPAAPGEAWRLRGFLAELDPATQRFRIGSANLDYSAAAPPAGLAQGQLVSLKLAASAGAVLQVVAFGQASTPPADAATVEVEGLVGPIGADGAFSVGGLRVDARGASFEPPPAALAEGAQVRIDGRMQGGMLVAATIRRLGPQEIEHRSYRLAGVADSVDVANASLLLRGVAVDFGTARFVNGSAGALLPGVALRVRGGLSSDGTRLHAEEIVFR